MERGRIDILDRGQGVGQHLIQAGAGRGDLGRPLVLLGGGKTDRGSGEQRVAIEAGIGRRVKKGVKRVQLPLRDRIKLMVVAGRTLAREAHEGVGHRGRAVDGVAEEQLIVDRAPLAGRHIAPGESGGHLLLERGFGQEVAGELPDCELIVRKVVVERLHNPVAVGPHLPLVVEVEPMGVGVAGGVEPVTGHLLAVVRAIQEPLDLPLVGVG